MEELDVRIEMLALNGRIGRFTFKKNTQRSRYRANSSFSRNRVVSQCSHIAEVYTCSTRLPTRSWKNPSVFIPGPVPPVPRVPRVPRVERPSGGVEVSQLLLIKGIPEALVAHDQHGITAPVLRTHKAAQVKRSKKGLHKSKDGRYHGEIMRIG